MRHSGIFSIGGRMQARRLGHRQHMLILVENLDFPEQAGFRDGQFDGNWMGCHVMKQVDWLKPRQ